jgi:hypothetical protein
MGLAALRAEHRDGSASTTWALKKVRVAVPPKAHVRSATKSLRWRSKARRDPRSPITITIRYRGGAEAWVEVVGRGEVNRYPGWVCLYDLLADVNSLGNYNS